MKKWIDYHGAIRLVDLNQDEDGFFTGYHFHTVGAVWVSPLQNLPTGFFDTAEEAIQYYIAQTREQLVKGETTIAWLASQVASINHSNAALRSRIASLESIPVVEAEKIEVIYIPS